MRILVVPGLRRGDPDLPEHVDRLLSRLVRVEVAVDLDELAELPPDGEDGVQRLHRVLEDDRDLAAADPFAHLGLGEHLVSRPQFAGAVLLEPEDRLAFELDLAADDLARAVDQPEDTGGRDGLARAGLADEPDDLSLVHVEGDPVDGADRPVFGEELCLEIAYAE